LLPAAFMLIPASLSSPNITKFCFYISS